MIEHRIDQLPMNRGAAVAGAREAVFERREVDPLKFFNVQRRTGSVRTARRARALGIVTDGTQGAWWKVADRLNISSGFTIGFSLRLGDLARNGTYPIATLHKGVALGGVANEVFRVVLFRDSGGIKLRIQAYDNGTAGSVTAETGALTVDGDYDLVFRYNTGTDKIELDGQGDDSIDIEGSTSGFVFNAANYQLSFLGDTLTSTTKVDGIAPVVSNIAVWTSYQSTPSAIYGNRAPSSPLYYYATQVGGTVVASTGSDTAYLRAFPAAPEVVDSALQFNGASTALRVELVPEIEQLFTTALRSVASTEFTFVLSGTRRRLSAREEYLVDFGGLAKIRFNTSDQVEFEYNGTTLTTTNTVGADTVFSIFAGRSGDTLFLTLDGTAATGYTSSDLAAPYVDLSRVPKLWLGAEDDPAATTHYDGSLSKLAVYRVETLRDLGPDTGTILYWDAAENTSRVTLLDQGPLNVGLIPAMQTEVGGFAGYAPGALADAEFQGILGGEVLAAGEVYGMDAADQRFTEALASDATGHRFGSRLLLASGGAAHVVNTEFDSVRPFGVPVPTLDVSRLATSVGLLSGAICYGYRWLTRDGTHGPIRRLDAISTGGMSRILLGSSAGEGSDLDTELGETYGRTEGAQSSPAATDASRFRLSTASGTPLAADGNHVVGAQLRMPDYDEEDLEELIWHRGIQRATGTSAAGDRCFLWTRQTSLAVNVAQNWTIQASFRYKDPDTEANAIEGQGIVAIAKSGAPTSAATTQNNSAFFAYITTGCAYYDVTAYAGNAVEYGTTANPRLVVGIARQEWNQLYGDYPDQPVSNYFTLTFTDDGSTWVDGHDYSVFFVRAGQGLSVYVYDKTADSWSTLTARTMDSHGTTSAYGGKTLPARSSYSGSDFFSGWTSPHNVHDIVFGSAATSLVTVPFMGGGGASGAGVGQPDQSEYLDSVGAPTANFPGYGSTYPKVKACGADVVHYHYRVWQRSVALNELKLHHEKRYAAKFGEPLWDKILYDAGCVLEDEQDTDAISDGKASLRWFGTEGRDITQIKHFVQDAAALKPTEQPLLVFSEEGTAFANSPLRLYLSALGDGRLVLDAGGEGRYILTTRVWKDSLLNSFLKKFSDFKSEVNEYDQFNWFHIALASDDGSGTTRLLRVKALAINGVPIFRAAIGGNANSITTWTGGWGHVGGNADAATTNPYRVDCAELRIYADGEGPDVEEGTGFNYLDARLPGSELANVLVYVKYQPGDTYNGGAGKASASDKLYQYGTEPDEVTLLESANPAFVYDPRTQSQSGSDPLPQVGFPLVAPRTDIVAIELVRTQTVPIEDFDDDNEVQKALDAAFGQPQYFLARLPIGATHYIDNIPDGALGYQIQDETFSVPPTVLQVFEWQGQLGVLSDNRRIFFAEPGPAGWETFPTRLAYEVRTVEGGSDVTAVRSTGDTLYVFGKDWCTAVIGGPGAEQEFPIGGGIGAHAPRATAVLLGVTYAFNGRLWMIDRIGQVDFQAQEIGGSELEGLLPTGTAVRLVASQALQSLLLINETSGEVLRFCLVNRQWTIEARDVLGAGDVEDAADGWITRDGAYAQGNTAVYYDDAGSASMTALDTGTLSGNVVTLGGAPTAVVLGLRCAGVDAAGDAVEARVTALSGADVTFDDLSALAAGAVTVYFGAGPEGMVVDSGFLNLTGQSEGLLLDHAYLEVRTGDSWEAGLIAAAIPGDWSSRADLEFAAVTAATAPSVGQGARGKFLRFAVRNRAPENAQLSYASFWARPAVE